MSDTESIDAMRVRKNCQCPSFKGLTWTQLRDLGTGCSKNGVCSVLDRYRRSVKPSDAERASEDLRLAKELGIGRGVGV